jgi:hypothetical protein
MLKRIPVIAALTGLALTGALCADVPLKSAERNDLRPGDTCNQHLMPRGCRAGGG